MPTQEFPIPARHSLASFAQRLVYIFEKSRTAAVRDEKEVSMIEQTFQRHRTDNDTVPHLPEFTAEAARYWNQVSELTKTAIIDSVWCTTCRDATSMQLREGNMIGRSLILLGACRRCGGLTARAVQPLEELG